MILENSKKIYLVDAMRSRRDSKENQKKTQEVYFLSLGLSSMEDV